MEPKADFGLTGPRGKRGRKKKQKKTAATKLPLLPSPNEEPLEYEYVGQDDKYRNISELVVDYGLGENNEGECTTLAHAVYQHRLLYGHLAANGLVNPTMKYVPYLYAPDNVQKMQDCLEAKEVLWDEQDNAGEDAGEGVELEPEKQRELEKERERFKKVEAEIRQQIAEIDREIAIVHQALEAEQKQESLEEEKQE